MKLAGEIVTKGLCNFYNIPYSIIRPSAVYGPTDMNRRVSQIFVESAFKDKLIEIEGKNEKLDFTYIEDLVQGIILTMKSPKSRNEIFNLTYGNSRSIQDLADVMRDNFDEVQIENVERDELMPFRGTLSVDKARKLIGYSPQNPIEIGFKKYIEWYRDVYREV